jgi:hypothetical protein
MRNTPTETPPTPSSPQAKNRHGCLTTWLILIIIAAIAIIIIYATSAGTLTQADMPGWAIPVLIILGIFEIICAIALFMWKKWGFWGFCALAIIACIVNLMLGLGVYSFSGLISIAILYGVLQIGGDNKGWPQLE